MYFQIEELLIGGKNYSMKKNKILSIGLISIDAFLLIRKSMSLPYNHKDNKINIHVQGYSIHQPSSSEKRRGKITPLSQKQPQKNEASYWLTRNILACSNQ